MSKNTNNVASVAITAEVYGKQAKDIFGVGRNSRGFAIGYAIVQLEIDIMNGTGVAGKHTAKILQTLAQQNVFGLEYQANSPEGKQVRAVDAHLKFLRDGGLITVDNRPNLANAIVKAKFDELVSQSSVAPVKPAVSKKGKKVVAK